MSDDDDAETEYRPMPARRTGAGGLGHRKSFAGQAEKFPVSNRSAPYDSTTPRPGGGDAFTVTSRPRTISETSKGAPTTPPFGGQTPLVNRGPLGWDKPGVPNERAPTPTPERSDSQIGSQNQAPDSNPKAPSFQPRPADADNSLSGARNQSLHPTPPVPGWQTPNTGPSLARSQAQGSFGQSVSLDHEYSETISLEEATRGPGIDGSTNANPLLASASNLLVLLGRLRTGRVRFEPETLRSYVLEEIDRFYDKARALKVPEHELAIAEYALVATADDLVQNSTGVDVEFWRSHSLASYRFEDRNAGTGFYEKLEEALRVPHQRENVLEFMLVCLTLGFQGAMRGYPDADQQLDYKCLQVHEALRRVRARTQSALSPNWTPIVLRGGRLGSRLPVWVSLSAATTACVGVFFALSWVLDRPTNMASEALRQIHTETSPIQVAIEISGATETLEVQQTDQLERLRAAFAPEIEGGQMSIEPRGKYIEIKVSRSLQFGSGIAVLNDQSKPLVERIASVLNSENGGIVVEGHTDSDKPSARSRYKTNQALSEARAETVRALMAQFLADPGRLEARGKGDSDADVPNTSDENKALNRRVEILLLAENVI